MDLVKLSKLASGWAKLDQKKNLSEQYALKSVRFDGMRLRFVSKQTPEICLAAVKQNAKALQYVKIQTPEICLAAVENDGNALQ